MALAPAYAPLAAEDLLGVVGLDEVDVSSHGRLAWVMTHLDSQRSTSRICVTHGSAPDAAAWDVLEEGATYPRWSPDGRLLAFLSARESTRPQLFVTTTARGAAARRLTNRAFGVQSPAWSPAGDRLVFVAPDDGASSDTTSRLWIASVETGETSEVTHGAVRDLAPTWSPDGTRFAFARATCPAGEGPGAEVCVVRITDGEVWSASRSLGFATAPSWSPDGHSLACLGTAEPRLGPLDAALQIWVLPAAGDGEPHAVTTTDDGVALLGSDASRGPAWSPDGRTLVVAHARRGRIRLARIGIETGSISAVAEGERQVTSWALNERAGLAAFVATGGTTPPELHTVDASGHGERRLTSVNRARASRPSWPTVEMRTFASPHGGTVEGSLLRPPRSTGPVPLLVALHGGPHSFVGPGFAGGHFFRYVLASRGWAVLALNGSGSSSYGLRFADSLRGAWGERDLPEHLAAVDALIGEGTADPDRLAVAGYSYGGYLAAWAVGHTDRFTAAVIGAPITDLGSFAATSDIGRWFMPFALGGGPGERPGIYRRLSPLSYADRVTTPTLILHGEEDRRCPIAQSEKLHTALVTAGRAPVEFVRYPGADHLFFRSGAPVHRVDYNRRAAGWLERHVMSR